MTGLRRTPTLSTSTSTTSPGWTGPTPAGVPVAIVADTPSVQHNGETIYFCCQSCATKFASQHEQSSVSGQQASVPKRLS